MGNIVSVLWQLCTKVEQHEVFMFHDSDGLDMRMELCQKQVDENTKSLDEWNKNKDQFDGIVEDVTVMKGLLQKYSNQLDILNDKVVALTARNMQQNIMINGLSEVGEENCKQVVIKFLSQVMDTTVEPSEVLVAHRIGQKGKKPRLMVVRCTEELKTRVLQNTKNLKDKKNSHGDSYYVNKQQPDKINEQQCEIRENIRHLKESEAHLPIDQRAKIEIRGGVLYTNKEPQKKQIHPQTSRYFC